MVLLFSCGCETDASSPAGLRFNTLTCDMPSTRGTKNWGTFTDTPPWATMLFIGWWECRCLEHLERKDSKGSSVQSCWQVIICKAAAALGHSIFKCLQSCGLHIVVLRFCMLLFLPVLVVIPGSSVLVWSRVSVAWIGVELLLIIPDIHGMTGVCKYSSSTWWGRKCQNKIS